MNLKYMKDGDYVVDEDTGKLICIFTKDTTDEQRRMILAVELMYYEIWDYCEMTQRTGKGSHRYKRTYNRFKVLTEYISGITSLTDLNQYT